MDDRWNNQFFLGKKQIFSFPYDLQWFAKEGPGGEKTEPATAKKLRESREEGQVAKSKELSSAIELVMLFLLLRIFVPYVGQNFLGMFSLIYKKFPEVASSIPGGIETGLASAVVRQAMIRILLTVAPFFAIAMVVAFLVSLVQVGWQPTAKPMRPKGSKISPKSGFKRIFSPQSLFELAKSIVRILLVGWIAYSSIRNHQDLLLQLYDIPLRQAITLVGTTVIDTGFRISLVYLIVGFADLIYQRLKFKREMKMTKQEVKDEMKNTEGNPEIKGRQRSRMREASQRRMMKELPTADVVITNPTHLAVAIKYDADLASAPTVIAKGQDYMAQKIREEAKGHGIELVENKPLAQMLYANVEIDQEVPPELYQAVAEVLAFVYSMKEQA